MFLEQIGADARVRELFRSQGIAGTELGRVSFASHEQYRVLLESAECEAVPAGRLRRDNVLPTVGDWVAVRHIDSTVALIEALLPRRTRFSRRAAGRAVTEQVIAANLDLAVVVCGLDGDFKLRRLERYLVLAHESGAEPVIVLNKADICTSLREAVEAVTGVSGDTRVIVLSAHESVEPLAALVRGHTIALLGSSGAGKSTIANGLLGEPLLATGAVRSSDSRGRHTTTSRMLMAMPGGGAVIDSPGLRELQLWASEEALDDAFEDISKFAHRCRFADCSHLNEPGCGVRQGIESGEIDLSRWRSYQKLQSEVRHQSLQQDTHARIAEKKRWKTITRALRKHPKYRR
ncbi:MAG TPA: ribosome small subunit-dependent GTPase A [Bryobacteraceae bacterium]|jgi:ribosome biogenesis GTPase|nr:ribosome small subunit-dependent GTPase A [Bryobacteraceae bacterium]